MATREITSGLKKKTLIICNNFFNDIAKLNATNINYELNLFTRVEKFFNDLNRLDKKEFRQFLELQKFTMLNNLLSCDSTDRKVMMDIFHCLIGLIILKHSESDVLSCFFPKKFREEVGRPVYSSNSWRITYWFEILTYWFKLLFAKKQYQINSPIVGDDTKLLIAINYIRVNMKNKDYIRLIKADDRFHEHLDIIFGYILGPILKIDSFTEAPTRVHHKTSCYFDFFINKALLPVSLNNDVCFSKPEGSGLV